MNPSTHLLFATQPQGLPSTPTLSPPVPCTSGDRCPTNTTVESIVLYRNHGNSTLFKQLDNTNLADAQGEVYWCAHRRACAR